jgi:hypothetical protein
MMNFKYVTVQILLAVSLMACAQSKHPVKNIEAVYSVHLPGTIAIDPNGNEHAPRDTVNIIYIETLPGNIQWHRAWVNNKTYSILPTLINTASFNAGTKKNTNETLILHATQGNKLWQLRFVPEESAIEEPKDISPGEILVEGLYNGKKIFEKISKRTEINSIPSQ